MYIFGGYIFTQELEPKGNYEKIAYFHTGTRLWELLAFAYYYHQQWQRIKEFGPDKNKLIKGRSQISEELFFIVLV